MKVFSGIYNADLEGKISALLRDQVEIVNDNWEGCDAAILATMSLTSKSGSLNTNELLCKITEANIPCLLIARNETIINQALEIGVPQERILNNPKVSLNEVAHVLMQTLGVDEYDITVDEDYQIEVYEKTSDIYLVPQLSSEPVKLNLPGKYAAITGIKGGVGVSTITAMIPPTINAMHVEVCGKDKQPTAYCYYGIDPGDAREDYAIWDGTGEIPRHKNSGLTVYDVGQSVPNEIHDQIIDNASCVVLVVDRSEISFELSKKLLKSGFRPDILVVSKTLGTGIGNGPEVYQGDNEEYLEGTVVLGLDGGLEEEKTISYTQKTGIAPCNGEKSVNIDMFVGEFVSAIRNILQI
jgi:hypothetical protein